MDYYFSHLYGMLPCHTLKFTKETLILRQFPSLSGTSPDKLSSLLNKDFEPWTDLSVSLDETTSSAISVPSNQFDQIQSRLQDWMSSHTFHPAILTMSFTQELKEPWFKDKDAADITIECLLLKAPPSSHATSSDDGGGNGKNLETIDAVQEEKRKLDFGRRDDLIQSVMRSYAFLCTLDPYLKVVNSIQFFSN
jgi:hypothetical protein